MAFSGLMMEVSRPEVLKSESIQAELDAMVELSHHQRSVALDSLDEAKTILTRWESNLIK
jgi:hypothetical protein